MSLMRGAISSLARLAFALAALAPFGCGEETGGTEPPADDEGDEPANYPASQACVVFPQSGCPPETHTCQVATASGATICESAGPGAHSQPCSGNPDCALGLACVYGQCRPHCQLPGDCPGPGAECVPVGQPPIAAWRSCTMACNPADSRNAAGIEGLFACAADSLCFPRPDATIAGSTDCFAMGTVPAGGACDSADCQADLVCLSDGTSSVCRPICLMGVTNCNCLPFAEPVQVAMPDGLREMGYCG